MEIITLLVLTSRFLIFSIPFSRIQAFQRSNNSRVSSLLDNLLRNYDNSLRPDFGGGPTAVEIDIMVKSMGPISEMDLTYSLDCYFRQSWVDRRLAFGNYQHELSLSISMLAKIWKPDTYFYNGRESHLHTITVPNKFVRLYRDGRVLYSSRLTIKANCPMDLQDFPMDIQHCPLLLGSFGYTDQDLVYKWNPFRRVVIAPDMKLSQFDLMESPAETVMHKQRRGNYSMLQVHFHLKRHMGNFMIQVYGPCVLLVVLSWVSFWLNREATADRISLGVTTILTMTFLGLEARTDLPKVPYSTALDLFLWLSYGFIFATIIEFAFVHFYTKYGYGEVYFPQPRSSPVKQGRRDSSKINSYRRWSRLVEDWSTANQTTGLSLMPTRNTEASLISSGLVHELRNHALPSNNPACLDEWNHSSYSTHTRPKSVTALNCTRTATVNCGSRTGQSSESEEESPCKHRARSNTNSTHSVCARAHHSNYIHVYQCDTLPDQHQTSLNYHRTPCNHKSQQQQQQQQFKTNSCGSLFCGQSMHSEYGQITAASANNISHIALTPLLQKRSTTRQQRINPAVNSPARTGKMSTARRESTQKEPLGTMHTQFNSVSCIDRISRALFPVVFLLLNIIYWCSYLTHSQRMTLVSGS